MLTRFKRSLEWTVVVKKYYTNDFEEFIELASGFSSQYGLDSYQKSLLGMALIFLKRIAEGVSVLSEVVADTDPNSGPKDEYLNIFCLGIIAELSGDSVKLRECRARLGEINAPLIYKKNLVL